VLLANLAVGVKLPKQVKPTHRTWTPEQLREFVTSVQAERLSALFVVLAFTGARRGEVLALRWSDVDVDGRAVRIERSATRGDDGYGEGPPKNGERRSVTVEAAVVAALRAWRKVQAAERLAWGPAYSPSDLVFTREDGSALDPDAVTKLFVRAVFGT
ncbi:MAG TPA: tyrosine-type recombinase/integrase, partial [Frankiaceae bacterium]|nr:tyrosine-type recombinase/integrase [Frankiaceae bacterium]